MQSAQPASSSRLLDCITRLFLEGRAIAHDDADFHRARIAWEFESGQWAIMSGPDNRLWGWLSYYRVTDEVLALLADLNFDALVERQNAHIDLTNGPNIYFATALVAPWAPASTFHKLCRSVMSQHRDVSSVAWHHRYPDGRSRFVHQPPDHEYV